MAKEVIFRLIWEVEVSFRAFLGIEVSFTVFVVKEEFWFTIMSLR